VRRMKGSGPSGSSRSLRKNEGVSCVVSET
jgi:hypothetical protein